MPIPGTGQAHTKEHDGSRSSEGRAAFKALDTLAKGKGEGQRVRACPWPALAHPLI